MDWPVAGRRETPDRLPLQARFLVAQLRSTRPVTPAGRGLVRTRWHILPAGIPSTSVEGAHRSGTPLARLWGTSTDSPYNPSGRVPGVPSALSAVL
jgi:hypothetical protein